MKTNYLTFIKRALLIPVSIVLVCVAVFSRAIQPVVEFTKWPVYRGTTALKYPIPGYDPSKKTVVIIADADGTEMFDMMAPYYLFNATGKANVYIIADKHEPVVVRKGLFVLPQLTFKQVDSLKIPVDLIVVPNQSVMIGMKQKSATVNFIRDHYTGTNSILSVCDGSATVAATGLYDGKPLTTHSSDYELVKKQYAKPAWTRGVSVTQSGNLYSTAGVSNATEGSLVVIEQLFGTPAMQDVLAGIHYPHAFIKTGHENREIQANSIFIAVRKGAFKSNERVGVILQEGVNEFELAGILDTYQRSFPAAIETFLVSGTSVTSKYGLTILATGDVNKQSCTEIHVLAPAAFSKTDEALFPGAKFVLYEPSRSEYILETCLARIAGLYGNDFANTVKLMLDYN
ncbi:MAG: hypothetical protein JWQ78_1479 [Sediminibacterium sp.]|nr:hypothetical protein [Sediminibacterium sp.]